MSYRDDLGFAWRSLAKSPAFALVAIVTLGLGIGVNSAIFSIVNAVLLKPLDLPEPDRLVFVNGEMTVRNVDYFPASPPIWREMNEFADQLVGIAAYNTFPNTLVTPDGEAEQVSGAAVSNNFFAVAGVGPFRGRPFNEADATFSPEDVPEGTPFPQNTFAPARVGILGHAFWQRRFGGREDVLGTVIDLGGNEIEIVGIMPPGFRFEMPPEAGTDPEPDLFLPIRIDYENAIRNNVFMNLVGRLKPGVSLAQAQAQLDAFTERNNETYEISRSVGWDNHYRDLHDAITAPVRGSVLILMAAVVFVLLIAAANVANLLLVRASARSRETAIRAALGGNRRRLLRQMLIEAGLIAAGGAVLGLLLAEAGIRFLHALGPDGLPRADQIGLDANVVLFTVAVAALATLLAGVVPALRVSRPNLVDELRQRSGSSRSSGGRWFRDGMVVLEVTLSFVLLVGAGLMVRSFWSLQATDPGFNAEGVLTFNLNLPQNVYPLPEDQYRFVDQFVERLGDLPGVEHVGSVATLPLTGAAFHGRYATEANAGNLESFRQANYRALKGDYFQVMETPLIAGRVFTRDDELSALPRVIVDDVLVRKNFPDGEAVGKKLMVRTAAEPSLVEIIGVVRHQDTVELQEADNETIFFTTEHLGFGPFGTFTVRTAGDPTTLIPAVRELVDELGRNVVVQQLQPMTEVVKAARAPTWFALSLIMVFGVIALLLASVGLYSVLSYIVRLRQGELGVRMAFGATPGKIFRLVVGRGLVLAAVGMVIGVAVGLSVTRLMRELLVGVSATDPATFGVIAGLFLLIAALASWLPARRATRVDPVVSLRWE